MKTLLVLFILLFLNESLSAQDKPNYSGELILQNDDYSNFKQTRFNYFSNRPYSLTIPVDSLSSLFKYAIDVKNEKNAGNFLKTNTGTLPPLFLKQLFQYPFLIY